MLEPGQKADAIPTPRAPERLGRYELVTRLGAGALAEVFLARQPAASGAEKVAAVHRIHAHLARVKEFVEVLLDEARAAALLEHPRVVDIYDLGVARGVYFIAMEYLAGQTLEAVIGAARRGGGAPLDVMSAARIVADAAEGLHAAHQLRSLSGRPLDLVHRDVCPRTIVVLHDGNVKLVDFGVARARALIAGGRAGAAQAGGREGYASPEQAAGGPLDRRSDVYSLGVVLWEALALRPFEAGGAPAGAEDAAPQPAAPEPAGAAQASNGAPSPQEEPGAAEPLQDPGTTERISVDSPGDASAAAAGPAAAAPGPNNKKAGKGKGGRRKRTSSKGARGKAGSVEAASSEAASSDDGWDLPAPVATVSAPPRPSTAPPAGAEEAGSSSGAPANEASMSAEAAAGSSATTTSILDGASAEASPAVDRAIQAAPTGGPVAPSVHRPEVPPELDRICLRALSRDPAERFQTAAEMQQAIEDVLAASGFSRRDGAIASFLARHFAAEREAGDALIRGALEPPDPILARGTSRRRTGPQGIESDAARPPPAAVAAPGPAASPGASDGRGGAGSPVAAALAPAIGPRGPAIGASAPGAAAPASSPVVPSPLGARRDGLARPEALFPAARVPVAKVPLPGAAPVGVVPMPGSRPNGAPATRGRGASGSQAEGADVTEVSELLSDLADGATEVAEAATNVVAAPDPLRPGGAASSTAIDVILSDGEGDPLAAASPARTSVPGNDLAPRSGETVVVPPLAAAASPTGAADARVRTGPTVQTMDDTLDVDENITDADLGARPRGKGRTGRIEAITGAWSDGRRPPTGRLLPLPAPPSSDRTRSGADSARASSAGDAEDDDDDFTVVDPEKSPRAFEAAATQAAAAARAATAPTQTATIAAPATLEPARPILPAHRARSLWVAALVGLGVVAALALILHAVLGEDEARPPGALLPGGSDVTDPAPASPPGGAAPKVSPRRSPAAAATAGPGAAAPAPIAPVPSPEGVATRSPSSGAAALPESRSPAAGAASPSSAGPSPAAGAASPSPPGPAPAAGSTGAEPAERRAPERARSTPPAAARTGAPARTTARIARERPRAAAPVARDAKPARAADPDQLYREGARLFLSGELEQARRAFQGAIAASPRFAPAHRGLGLVHERTGDRPRAIRSLQNYLRLAPSAADADAIRARLDRLRR